MNSGGPQIPGHLFDEDISDVSDMSSNVDEDDSDECSYASDTSNNDEFPDTFRDDYHHLRVESYLFKYNDFKEQREKRKKKLRLTRRRDKERENKLKEVMLPKMLQYQERKVSQIQNAIRAINESQADGEMNPLENLKNIHYIYDLYSSRQCRWLEDFEFPVGHQICLPRPKPAPCPVTSNLEEPNDLSKGLVTTVNGFITLSEAYCDLDAFYHPQHPGEIMIDAWTTDGSTGVKRERVHMDLIFLNDTYLELRLPAHAVYGLQDERGSTPRPPNAPLWFEFYGERQTLETLRQRDADSKELYTDYVY
ncbi:hypothetical protein CkaCkLH20_05117 [Colletotrichum karsti]|uniref:Uncharacterized protein n=1 Tax=Colletotrichum karsti TaxID=1095194 RepID=A0A9P6I7Z1_9PEZI|nr:uncharacterized protein CkaCkLH20_05117 [Colletotrichum karsti]KAF9877417.1 hypothetical protein CkaCkLH20_05117 [Colletotrichum karsti]